jgi:hypothetical protein
MAYKVPTIRIALMVAVAALLVARPGAIFEFVRNLLALSNVLLFAFAVGTLAWFVYWVFLRRMLRARRIANARMKRMLQEDRDR